MRSQVLLDHIIKPTLEHLAIARPKMNSKAAQQFMVAVAAQESNCGDYFKQLGNGPAEGIWQVEPSTQDSLYQDYINYRPDIAELVSALLPQAIITAPAISCPMYCCAIARLVVYRQPVPMPEFGDKEGMWEVYKKYFNSYLGKATKEEWDYNWDKYVVGLTFS